MGKVSTVCLLAIFLLAIGNRHSNDRYRNADLKSASNFILENSIAGQMPIIVVSGYMTEPLTYYLDNATWKISGIPMDADFENREQEFGRIVKECQAEPGRSGWLVYTREFHEDSDGVLIGMLREVASLEQVQEYAGVRLYRLEFGS